MVTGARLSSIVDLVALALTRVWVTEWQRKITPTVSDSISTDIISIILYMLIMLTTGP